MKINNLIFLKSLTTWGGVAISFSGVLYNLSLGGDIWGILITTFGIIITCIGNFIGSAISKREKEKTEEAEARIEYLEIQLECESEQSEANREVLESYAFKRMYKEAKGRYEDEMQDWWR